jgi:hypothetical protein
LCQKIDKILAKYYNYLRVANRVYNPKKRRLLWQQNNLSLLAEVLAELLTQRKLHQRRKHLAKKQQNLLVEVLVEPVTLKRNSLGHNNVLE